MEIKVGQDIESLCGKCGDVWHVVVAMKGAAVAKVQCKQCSGYHRHRPPGGAPKASKPRATGTRGSTRKKKVKEPDPPAVLPDPSRPRRPYQINETFELGDTVDHAKFGIGVVEIVLPDRKIQVYFPDGARRVLAHQR